ncbi:uncharacterized protein LOC117956823 [Etheostoma cragini]|uniref:uncharacterized protein LOC117956823 n=1 Tax=Etheostoma cragini TaxID=417921 RepID=UPI00155E86B0|nr:uncharacterized protein LOC117956823 [Etheostoma cragini]
MFARQKRLNASLQTRHKRKKMAKDPIYGKRHRLDDGPVKDSRSEGPKFVLLNFPSCNGKKGADYLTWVSDFVTKNRNETVNLTNPAGATWKIGNLDDTIYSGADDEVNGWNNFYLPEPVNMQVIGVVEGTSCPCEQLVLMTCEDRHVYAYDGEGEELHVVASSLNQLHHAGMEYPASKTYYDGEAFKDMTEEDWAEVRKGPVGKKLDHEHHELVMSNKSSFLDNLNFTTNKIFEFQVS